MQTAPKNGWGENAGNLYLQAQTVDPKTGKVLEQGAKSSGFSVSAIPITVTLKYAAPAEGTIPKDYVSQNWKNQDASFFYFNWGAIYTGTLTSDSGDVRDLDQIGYKEVVKSNGPIKAQEEFGAVDKKGEVRDLNSVFQNMDRAVYKKDEARARKDAVAAEKKLFDASKLKTLTQDQLFIFVDKRTMDSDLLPAVIANSGFHVEMKLAKKGDEHTIQVTRVGQATTIKDESVRKQEWTVKPGQVPADEGKAPPIKIE